jgi:hypothetical protein
MPSRKYWVTIGVAREDAIDSDCRPFSKNFNFSFANTILVHLFRNKRPLTKADLSAKVANINKTMSSKALLGEYR